MVKALGPAASTQQKRVRTVFDVGYIHRMREVPPAHGWSRILCQVVPHRVVIPHCAKRESCPGKGCDVAIAGRVNGILGQHCYWSIGCGRHDPTHLIIFEDCGDGRGTKEHIDPGRLGILEQGVHFRLNIPLAVEGICRRGPVDTLVDFVDQVGVADSKSCPVAAVPVRRDAAESCRAAQAGIKFQNYGLCSLSAGGVSTGGAARSGTDHQDIHIPENGHVHLGHNQLFIKTAALRALLKLHLQMMRYAFRYSILR